MTACQIGTVLAVIFSVLAAAVPQPTIVQKPIPFPAKRKQEMAAYAKRHYGLDTYRLRDPKITQLLFVARQLLLSSLQDSQDLLQRLDIEPPATV